MSLRDSDSSFVLQKKFNQSTLMSSAFSLLTLELIGCIESLNSQAYVNPFLQNQDKTSGLIIDPKTTFDRSSLEDPEKNYIHYQTTAFSLSAIDALGYAPEHSLVFLDYFRDKNNINKYFENIDWSNPWHESNKIMFLLQFFSFELIRLKDESAKKYIDQILDLLDKYQDSKTGLWGTQYGASSFSAMAAGFHFIMFYQHFNRDIRFKELVVESVCNLQMKDGLFHPFGGGGACEDMDAIDMLVKSMNENEPEALRALERSHSALIKNFNSEKKQVLPHEMYGDEVKGNPKNGMFMEIEDVCNDDDTEPDKKKSCTRYFIFSYHLYDKNFTLTNKLFQSESPLFLGEYHQVFKNSYLMTDFGYTEGYKKSPGSRSHFFSYFVN